MTTRQRPFASPRPYEQRRVALDDRRKSLGLSKADVARGIGYVDEAGTTYVRQVFAGTSTSRPVLDRIEAFLDQHEAAPHT